MEIPVDYTGFTIPDQFVVGYGLDYGELYRNLRYVGVLKPEVYSGVARPDDDASPAARPGTNDGGHRWRADGRRLRPAVVAGRRHAGHHRRVSGNGMAGQRRSSSSSSGSRRMALVALPYAAGDRPVGLDRWLSFAILAVAGWIGFGWRVVELAICRAPSSSTRPAQVFTNGPGLWLAAIGLVVLSRATWTMTREPAYR